jgi:hypothetical protein
MMFQAADTFIEAANNFGDTREGSAAGPLALAVVSLLGIATFLLWRNMTKRIKRLPAAFPREESPAGAAKTAVPEPVTTASDDAPASAASAAPADRGSKTES